MCGIAGIRQSSQKSNDHLEGVIKDMIAPLAHRGPDSSGYAVFPESGLALGHTRLSILELSELGSQPMHSKCGRFSITYNGEVYNHLEIRKELEKSGESFSGTSDTETILAAIACWGLQAAVTRFVGMFAFALWDKAEQTITLVRDRLGIKPLYYATGKGCTLFASELKSLRNCPGFDATVDKDALSAYLRYGYIPAPMSVYQTARKLPPGTMLTIDKNNQIGTPEPYWSAEDAWQQGLEAPFAGTEQEALLHLETVLKEAVGIRLLSDVPLGAFLSGGIDSSLVVALMARQSTQPVRTFTIGFNEEGYNEAQHAKQIAQHLGTDHTELYLTPKDLLDTVPDIPRYWDEPFADASQIPTYLLSKMTREHVTVALSGDGGDELFWGYQRYFWGNYWQTLSTIPHALRSSASTAAQFIPRAMWGWGNKGGKLHSRLDLLGKKNFPEFYQRITSAHPAPASFLINGNEVPAELKQQGDDLYHSMSLWDVQRYLPDDILTKVDRATMAHGLEARVPLLDHRVVEFAASLPRNMKLQQGKGKLLLRRLLDKHVPRELTERPKQGFTLPVEAWMRREIRPWCEDMLNPATIRSQGLLDETAVTDVWTRFKRGQNEWHPTIWALVMFQAWLAENKL